MQFIYQDKYQKVFAHNVYSGITIIRYLCIAQKIVRRKTEPSFVAQFIPGDSTPELWFVHMKKSNSSFLIPLECCMTDLGSLF